MTVYKQCCILQGELAEIIAKSTLLKIKLSKNPELIDEIEESLERLEEDMARNLKSIIDLDLATATI